MASVWAKGCRVLALRVLHGLLEAYKAPTERAEGVVGHGRHADTGREAVGDLGSRLPESAASAPLHRAEKPSFIPGSFVRHRQIDASKKMKKKNEAGS